jgi:hypothetical protein
MDTIEAMMDCFALFFHLSVVNIANQPESFAFNFSSIFTASWSRIEPDKVHQSGTTAPGTHFWTNNCICGLFTAFHGAQIAMRSLHKSSPNSNCNAGVHGCLLERGESLKVLDAHLCFGGSSESRDMVRRRGL